MTADISCYVYVYQLLHFHLDVREVLVGQSQQQSLHRGLILALQDPFCQQLVDHVLPGSSCPEFVIFSLKTDFLKSLI